MSKFEISKNEGQHSRFVPLLGRWTGMCKTWFEKDVSDQAEFLGDTNFKHIFLIT